MKQIRLEPIGRDLAVATSSTLVAALLREAKGKIKTVCGGKGLCATCHVHVVSGAHLLTPPTDKERARLPLITGANGQSRLACQARVLGDGVVVEVPKGIYLEGLADLEALIGRRAEEPLLHPGTGQTLVPEGKIITRSVVKLLEKTSFNVSQVLQNTMRAEE